jgi:hypothetical protein
LKRFYYERDDIEGGFCIMEAECGYEQGIYFDVAIAVVTTEPDAVTICNRLNQLWENQK